jgi:hypothetical protein
MLFLPEIYISSCVQDPFSVVGCGAGEGRLLELNKGGDDARGGS